MMHCGSEKPNVTNIYRLAPRLPIRHMCRYQATLVSFTSGCENEAAAFFSLFFPPEHEVSRTRLAGAVSWVVGVA